jgi:hypothetical protein
MRTGERYYNSTRGEQIVRLKTIDGEFVVYEVEQGNVDNPITTFKCTAERFYNLYIKIGLSRQSK